MIIPVKDFKLSVFKTPDYNKPIHVLSTSNLKKSITSINTQIISRDIVLSSCVEKDYVIAFDEEDPRCLKKFEQYPYHITQTTIKDMMTYCSHNKASLLIKAKKDHTWYRIDPDKDLTSIHYISFCSH